MSHSDVVIHCETPADVWQAVDAVLPRLSNEARVMLERLRNKYHERYLTAMKIAEDSATELFRQVNNRGVSALVENLAEAERKSRESGLIAECHYDGMGQRVDRNLSGKMATSAN